MQWCISVVWALTVVEHNVINFYLENLGWEFSPRCMSSIELIHSANKENNRQKPKMPYGRVKPNLRYRRRDEGNGNNPTKSRRPQRTSTKPSSLKQQVGLALAAVASIAAWYLTPISDWVVDIVIDQIPLDADVELQREALRSFPYENIFSPTWSSEIRDVGKDLIRALKTLPTSTVYNFDKYDWDFGVIHADFANAFCLPGGAIRVTDALLKTLEPTTGELAALLGHEIGHVVSRHAQKRLLTEKLLSFVLSALTYEDHDDDRETFGEALGELITKSASWLGQQRFSRRDEYQADAVSCDLLFAGKSNNYNPQSLESLLTKLQSLEKGHASDVSLIAAWSRTHPATTDRLKAVNQKWSDLPITDRRRLGMNPI